ncbi:MAG: hypothetical protein ACFKPT_20360 [Gloeotrichia echinulata GP01]
METFTLQQIFGENSTQDIDTLTISKVDLLAVGLTPTASNTAESLIVALILKLLSNFLGNMVDSNFEDLIDSNGGKISYQEDDIYQDFYCFYWRKLKVSRQNTPYILDQIIINEYS